MVEYNNTMQSILQGLNRLQRQFLHDEIPAVLAKELREIDEQVWSIVDIAEDPDALEELEGNE